MSRSEPPGAGVERYDRRTALGATLLTAWAAAGCGGPATAPVPGAEPRDAKPAGATASSTVGASAPAPAAQPAGASAVPARAVTGQRGIVDAPPPRLLLVRYALRDTTTAATLGAALASWARTDRADRTDLTAVTGTVGALPGLYRRLALPAPAALREPPAFPGDRLERGAGDGDLLVQWCGPTRAACAEAAEEFAGRLGAHLGTLGRQEGFLPATAAGATPRNLFGFKDGTENPPPADHAEWVWRPNGATYLVYRRIHMDTTGFGALPVPRQEAVIGRVRDSGAPLTGRRERDPVDLYAKSPAGRYVIPVDAHIRLAHSRLDRGARMLRRGYSYDHGPGDRGLLFLAYMRDPALFTRVQQRLADGDAMSAFVEHRASAVAYVPPPFGDPGPPRWT
ncbi:Dyp-type peroxidase (plasmid) [Streptomyces sp. BI20]|uniref:Dyp-type peroxidase n=1 Tax=Streptomyces sp. BI20 TaxID=3403460 RepID=UPI003C717D03